MRYLGTHDLLTGLSNRAFLEETLARLTAGRQQPVTLVAADVDGLKRVNDMLGHAAGDALLQRAARVLRQAFRADDVVARVGGDGFVAVLPRTNAAVGRVRLGRLRSLLAQHNAENPERTCA